jgi:phage terminase large subunit
MKIEFPEKFDYLFRPKRYKIAYGGRGGSKSWAYARALLLRGASEKTRILCAREIQDSIRDSVHKLLSDQIDALGLSSFYEIQNANIFGKNGTEFSFIGLKNNPTKVKSYEGVDVVWIEEAATVSKRSWDVLVPTIRKEGSEIWISFNPELETDETYKRFVLNPPPDSVVIKINYDDNPWLPDTLRAEMEHSKATDPDAYNHIWLGFTKKILDGAVYAKELRRAEEANRFTRVPYDQSKPVHTFWDLGRADKTAIWFAQIVGLEFRVIDFYENSGEAIGHYMKHLQSLQYVYGDCWLPHDAQNELLASERTIEQQMRAAGFKVRITPKQSISSGIEASRALFGQLWFDEERCADGINALRHYRYEVDPDTKMYSDKPLHDHNSHAADAFRYMAIALKEPKKIVREFKTIPRNPMVTGPHQSGGWM